MEYNTMIQEIGTILATVNDLSFVDHFDSNVDIQEYFYNVELTLYTKHGIYNLSCGFGSGGHYISSFEVDFDMVLYLLKHSCR